MKKTFLIVTLGLLAAGSTLFVTAKEADSAASLNTDKVEALHATKAEGQHQVQNGFFGWFYDNTLKSWTYWEGYWLFHEDGLGYLWAAGYDFYNEYGWLYDGYYGWLYTDAASYPYFFSDADQTWYWYDDNSANPRWFWNSFFGYWESSYGW